MGGLDTFLKIGSGTNAAAQSVSVTATSSSNVILVQTGGALLSNAIDMGNSAIGAAFYNQSGGFNTVIGQLSLGVSSGSRGTYSLSGSGVLKAQILAIGKNGIGTFTHNAGSIHVGSYTFLGYYSGGSGTYNLSGTGTAETYAFHVGSYGSGSVDQSDGSNLMHFLYLGQFAGGNGTYSLSGNGLLQAGNASVGYGGTGIFNQTGGNHELSSALTLGYDEGSSGTYNLSGGILNTQNEYVGWNGSGSFKQTGGTHTIANELNVASHAGSSGSFNLEGGALNVASLNNGGSFYLEDGTLNSTSVVNDGDFNLDGGNFGSGTLYNNEKFNFISGSFEGRLVNNGHVNISATNVTFGNGVLNSVSFPTITPDQIITLNGAGLDNKGIFNLEGGTVNGTGNLVNNASMTAFGTIGGSGGFTNNALFEQGSGNLIFVNTGTNTNNGNMDLVAGRTLQLGNDVTLKNTGALNLNAAIINGSGNFINAGGGTLTGRGSIATANFSNTGTVALTGGVTNITAAFINSGVIQLDSNTATLRGGAVTNSGRIEGHGLVNNTLTNMGTIEAQNGTLTLSGPLDNAGTLATGPGSSLLFSNGLTGNSGSVQLNGGTLSNNGHTLTNSGQILASTGASRVFGSVYSESGSQIIVSGGGAVSFYDEVDIMSGAELRISNGSIATFFSLVHQRTGSSFTGTGTKYYEGGLSVGASPGQAHDEGDVVFGVGNTYIAEIGGLRAGSEYDFYDVGGSLTFGGTLQLVSWNGFVAQAGDTFDLFDWGSEFGRFSNINANDFLISGGTMLDTSRLYSEGVISVLAVPEPESYLMMIVGFGLVGFAARRRARRS